MGCREPSLVVALIEKLGACIGDSSVYKSQPLRYNDPSQGLTIFSVNFDPTHLP
jgi:hypothetical protein